MMYSFLFILTALTCTLLPLFKPIALASLVTKTPIPFPYVFNCFTDRSMISFLESIITCILQYIAMQDTGIIENVCEELCSYENLETAFNRARRGKTLVNNSNQIADKKQEIAQAHQAVRR